VKDDIELKAVEKARLYVIPTVMQDASRIRVAD
jgi:hypothetical protein